MPDFAFATISQLSDALRKREVSSVELVKYFGERLEKIGPKYNALALSLVDDAHDLAKTADREIKRDRWRGALHGIPCAVKDLFAVAKHPTTWGAKPFAGQVFDYSATVVDRLADARAPLIGKLSMVELAGGLVLPAIS